MEKKEGEEPWNLPMTAEYVYFQKSDSCDPSQNGQTLEIKIDNAGDGPFIIIKTERWAIDSDDIFKFAEMLRDAVRGKTGMRNFF